MTGNVPKRRGSFLWYNFCHDPMAVVSVGVLILLLFGAVLAVWIAPQNPFDPASLNLMNSFYPPVWMEGGQLSHVLGTDDQGRDLFSAILYGTRVSLIVGMGAVTLSVIVGVSIGLLAGYAGGWTEALLMRAADVQLTVPAILIALMIDGFARAALPSAVHEDIVLYVLIFSIGIADWPQYARVVRSATLRERVAGYVAAARVIGVAPAAIVLRHIVPNVITPVLVLAALGLALAVIAEATLSFLGVGMPATTPSLGTLIRVGNDYLFSGEWWIILFPSLTLVLLALSVNVLGDWMRAALSPRLR